MTSNPCRASAVEMSRASFVRVRQDGLALIGAVADHQRDPVGRRRGGGDDADENGRGQTWKYHVAPPKARSEILHAA
mgnify:CR=1 FL=1